MSKGLLNGKIFYYYEDIKINELGYRIQFLLDNFDKINLNTVKYLQKDFLIPKFNPYSPFYHPHFLIQLKNDINCSNNFYINFQLSSKPYLNFEKLTNQNLSLKLEIQYISPEMRVYDTNLISLQDDEYTYSFEFIDKNKYCINDYIFKNLNEYVPNFKSLK